MKKFFEELLKTEKDLGVHPDQHSYFLSQDTKPYTAVLAVHGFLANPIDTQAIGTYLHAQGNVDVLGIRMSGHGLTPERLKNTHWQEWVASVHRGYKALKANYEKVVLLGISGGALVALNLAEENPADGIICLSTMLHAADWRLKYGGPVGPVVHTVMKNVFQKEYLDSNVPEHRKHIVYNRMPIASTIELFKLMRYTRRSLYRVECPMLIVHSTQDDVAHPSSAKELYQKVLSPDKELHWVEGEHVFINEQTDVNEKVFQKVASFAKNPTEYFSHTHQSNHAS
ncbi:alpha/beta fold hydrolase [bacterium]|jgi:carboxylesterase|nr:alpha/beta fold hydrolase [bacterium]